MALNTALPMAAAVEMVGGSPMPITPRSGMSIMWTVIFGMSLDAAELVELHVGVDLPAGRRSQDALLEQGVVEAHDDAAGHLRLAGQLVDDQAAVLHGDHVLEPGPPRSRCRPAPRRSARRRPGRWRCSRCPARSTGRGSTRPCPWPRPCRAGRRTPSTPTPCLFFVSTTLPGSIARSFGSAPTLRWRPSLNRSSRAACGGVAASPGPATGRSCCRRSRWSSRTGSRRCSRRTSVGIRPRISAATMAVTVRWAVPRSCVEVSAVTTPSLLMVTVHSFGRVPPAANPPQVCSAMPMPCLIGPWPGPLPGGCHLSFQPGQLQGDVELLVVDVVPPAGPGDRVLGLHVRVVGRQVLAADDERVDAELGRQVVDGELGQDAVLRVARGPHGPGPAGVDQRDRVRPLPVRDRVEVDVGQQVRD